MSDILALLKLYDDVVARFAAEAPLPAAIPIATQYFGWREVAKQRDEQRIIWVPGEPGGSIGAVVAPRYPGERATGRPLTNILEAFHCYVTGYDRTAPTNERLQYIAARHLLDELIRAIYLAAHGNFELKSSSWVTDKKEFRAGATILLTGTIRSLQVDTPRDVAPVGTGAIVDLECFDVTEELRVPADHVPSSP